MVGLFTGAALYGKGAADRVRIAIDNGITHLDGARVYINEESLRVRIRASGKPRSESYIVSKANFVVTPAQTVQELLRESLRLGMGYVDLFLIHSARPTRKGAWGKPWRESRTRV